MNNKGLKTRIRNFTDRLEREDVNMHGYILSVRGEEKARAYYAPFKEGQPHRMYSVSKTMTGIAIGMLIGQGKLSLDDPVADYFKDWVSADTDPRILRVTIRDMLRMATCYRKTAYKEGIDENWARAFFTAVPTHEPGTVFHYDTGCSQVLAALAARISGREVIDFLEEQLFAPLGCTDEKYWLRDPSGCCQGGSGLCMSLRDMHKVALCLADGGRGIIPAWFVEGMSKKQIETLLLSNEEERYGYGWQCWQIRSGWAMYGMGGQLAMICPDKQVVFSTIADTRMDPFGVQRIYNAFFEEVYPYIDSEDMEPEAWNLTVHSLPNLTKGSNAEEKNSKIADPAGTATYLFEAENPLQIKSLRLQGNCLYYENARGSVKLPFGLGENKQISYPGWPDVPALASGCRLDDELLRIRCYAIDDSPCGFDMLLHFRNDLVTVQCKRSADIVTAGYDGVATGRIR